MAGRTQNNPFFTSNLNYDISRLPYPYRNWNRAYTDPGVISVHHAAGVKASLNLFITKALLAYCKGKASEIGVVRMMKASYVSQWDQPDGSSLLATADKNILFATKRSENGAHSDVKRWNEPGSSFDLTSIFMLFMLIEADINEEQGRTDHTITWDLLNATKTEYELTGELKKEVVYLVCDDVEWAIKSGVISTGLKMGNISPLTADRVNIGEFRSGTVICGNPSILKPDGTPGQEMMTVGDAKRLVEEYTSTLSWTPEEEELIPQFPDDTPVPPEAMKFITRFVKSRGKALPMTRLCWRGITAYGKSTGVDIMACILHTPKLEMTCSYNTEEQDFHSQFVPNEALTSDRIAASLPCFDDIENDPEYAYEQITGHMKERVTADECLRAYGDAVAARSGGAHFKLVESDYVKALTRGYLIEIQEFSRIRDSGVLVKLNKYDKPGAIIPLVNGDHMRRHENALEIYTDNVGYNSCRPVDPSVMRRMSFIIDSYDMPKERALKRVKANTGCENDDRLDAMYEVWKAISEHCHEHDITEGPISLTELERWVSIVEMEGESAMIESCLECIVAKVTSSPEEQKQIMDECANLEIAKAWK